MGGPSFTELISGIAKKSPSQSGVRHSLVGSFLVCFLGEASRDSQIGFCLPNRVEIIMSKCYYKDKNRFVITMISPFLVNVSLGWYLLLLDFGIKGWSGRGFTCSHTLHCYRKTWLFWKMAAQVGTRTHLLFLCRCGDSIQVWQQSLLHRGIYPSCHLPGPIQVSHHPSKCRDDGRNPHLPFKSHQLSPLLWGCCDESDCF